MADDSKLERAARVARALGTMFTGTRVPVWALRPSGAFVSANAAAIAQYGYSLAELLELRVQDIIADGRSIETDLAIAASGDAWSFARRPHRRKDGSLVWVVPTPSSIGVDGETLIVSFLQDVTPIIEAEVRAREASEAALRDRQLVLNAVVAMLRERDLAPAVDILTRAFADACGERASMWLPDAPASRRLQMVASHGLSDEGKRVLPAARIDLDRETFGSRAWSTGVACRVLGQETAEGTVERATADRMGDLGYVAPLMGRAGPYGLLYCVSRGGDDERALALATTLGSFGGLVLEAVQLEAQVALDEQRAEVLWQAASERLNDGIALLDRDCRIVRMNSAELRLLGLAEAPVGRACREVFPMCRAIDPCPHRTALDEQRRFVKELTGSISNRPLRIEVMPTPASNPHFAVIHVAHDLTEERAIRSQLVTADRLATIGRLAAGVAHEVNNPAALVTVNLGVLRDRFAAGTARAAEVTTMLEESLAGMDRIREIVRDLKGFARERSRDRVDLSQVAASAVRMAAHETRGRARVDKHLDPGVFAHARGPRIAQVVLNLVVNAAQAIPHGPSGDHSIVVRAYREGDKACIDVTDTGPGVAPALRDRIFEPFFTTREASGGTGLGLWLAREIVEEEGGTITYAAGPGGGARFTVELAAAKSERAMPAVRPGS